MGGGGREPYKLLDLFSGIGGFSLGLERTGGFKTVAFCESHQFCQRVLRKHWPEVPIYHDIKHATAAGFPDADVISAGFPCQDISTAGSGAGLAGERSGLWREAARIIRGVRPKYVVLENVAALRSRGLDVVLGDLAAVGLDAIWHCVPAAYVGAGHPRDRIWIVAYAKGERRPEIDWNVEAPTPLTAGQSAGTSPQVGRLWEPESDVVRVVHGLPNRVDRIAALGNAVVPQIPELIGHAILASEAA